jgi:hypothetical protein
MNKSIKWAAKLEHVREVSLLGAADLRFWTDWLEAEDLRPAEREGQAQLMIVAADAKFMSLRFQELSVSVVIYPPDQDESRDAAFLIGAFNSRPFFAFCERVLFSTPYEHGRVSLTAATPAAIELVKDHEPVFRASMGDGDTATPRESLRTCDDGWEGPILLPNKRRRVGQAGKLFYARLRGNTKVYRFAAADSLVIEPTAESEVLRAIRDSHFVAKEWVIREDATHAKSTTYCRERRVPSG